jgi:hypothetical protein
MTDNKAWEYMIHNLICHGEEGEVEEVGAAYTERFLFDGVAVITNTTQHYKKERSNDGSTST